MIIDSINHFGLHPGPDLPIRIRFSKDVRSTVFNADTPVIWRNGVIKQSPVVDCVRRATYLYMHTNVYGNNQEICQVQENLFCIVLFPKYLQSSYLIASIKYSKCSNGITAPETRNDPLTIVTYPKPINAHRVMSQLITRFIAP